MCGHINGAAHSYRSGLPNLRKLAAFKVKVTTVGEPAGSATVDDVLASLDSRQRGVAYPEVNFAKVELAGDFVLNIDCVADDGDGDLTDFGAVGQDILPCTCVECPLVGSGGERTVAPAPVGSCAWQGVVHDVANGPRCLVTVLPDMGVGNNGFGGLAGKHGYGAFGNHNLPLRAQRTLRYPVFAGYQVVPGLDIPIGQVEDLGGPSLQTRRIRRPLNGDVEVGDVRQANRVDDVFGDLKGAWNEGVSDRYSGYVSGRYRMR